MKGSSADRNTYETRRARICITEGGSSDETPKNRPVDPIPVEWSALGKVQFDVPAGGTDKANFDIETKRPGK